jgi:hypothetical protein
MKRYNHSNTRVRLVELTPISDRLKQQQHDYLVSMLHTSLGLPLPTAQRDPLPLRPRVRGGSLTFQPFAALDIA